jgi:IS30 family transposase
MTSFHWNNVAQLPDIAKPGKQSAKSRATTDRAPSTIARELKRNSGSKVGYRPAYAESKIRAVNTNFHDAILSGRPAFRKRRSRRAKFQSTSQSDCFLPADPAGST